MAKGYKVIEVHRTGVERGMATFCEHCGRVIFNFAILESATGYRLRTGLDCMTTLCKGNHPEKQLSFNF